MGFSFPTTQTRLWQFISSMLSVANVHVGCQSQKCFNIALLSPEEQFPASFPSRLVFPSSTWNLELTCTVCTLSPEIHRKLSALLGNRGLPSSCSLSCLSSLPALFSQHDSIPHLLPCSSHPLGICSICPPQPCELQD